MSLEKNYRIGPLKVAVWKNEGKDGNFKTVSITRAYKDKEGNWKENSSFKIEDLPKISVTLNRIFDAEILA